MATNPRHDYQRGLMARYDRMLGVYPTMPAKAKQALTQWEAKNLDGVHATSNWPGWSAFCDMTISLVTWERKPSQPQPKATIAGAP